MVANWDRQPTWGSTAIGVVLWLSPPWILFTQSHNDIHKKVFLPNGRYYTDGQTRAINKNTSLALPNLWFITHPMTLDFKTVNISTLFYYVSVPIKFTLPNPSMYSPRHHPRTGARLSTCFAFSYTYCWHVANPWRWLCFSLGLFSHLGRLALKYW